LKWRILDARQTTGGITMPYIESHIELGEHPKLEQLTLLLGVSAPQALGHLHYLWYWSFKYSKEGSLAGYKPAVIAKAAKWEGDASTFVDALLNCGVGEDGKGFLEHDEHGALYIHDWWDYAGAYLDKKRANTERQRKHRDKHRDVTVTSQSGHGDDGAPAGVTSPCPSAQQTAPSLNRTDPCATMPVARATNDAQPQTTAAPTVVPTARRTAQNVSQRNVGASVDKPSDDDLAQWKLVADCIRDNVPAYSMGIPPVVQGAVKERLSKLSGGCVVKAITETIQQGKVGKDGVPVWKYAWAICDRWIEQGVTQVEDIEPLQRDHEYRKQKDKHERRGDTGAFAPLSDEDKRKADALTKQLAARLNINGKAVRK
jgi:hypothetical protein